MFDHGEMSEGGAQRLASAVASLDARDLSLVADLAEAFASDPQHRTAGELTDSMRSLDRLHAVLDDATLRTWSAWEATLAYADDGYRAPGPWVSANLCVRPGVARYAIGLGRKLRSGFPHVGEAARAGRLGRSKVELLVKARADDIADVFDAEEEQLVVEVEGRTVEAADLYLATWRLEVLERLRQNDKDPAPPPESERSTLQLLPILDERSLIRGELDLEDSALVGKAIDDRMDQWFAAGILADDPRTRKQLQAAALVDLVRGGTAPANRGKGARPLVLALIDADTLTARATTAYQTWLAQLSGGHGGGDSGAPGPSRFPWSPGGIDGRGTSPAPSSPDARGPDPRQLRKAAAEPEPGAIAASAGSSFRTRRRVRRRGPAGAGRGTSPPGWPRQTIEPLGGAGSPPSPTSRPPMPAAPTPPGSERTSPPERPAPASGAPPPDHSAASLLHHVHGHLADLARFASSSPRVSERMPFRSELVGAGPVDPSVIEQLLCAADLVPVLHRDHSEILDVGRSQRLATPVQRRALVVRSGGTCEWPGCTVPHNWCDAHHLHFWERGGPTDLSNLALVCNHHHSRFHRAGYTAVVRQSGLEVFRPDGSTIQPSLSGRW